MGLNVKNYSLSEKILQYKGEDTCVSGISQRGQSIVWNIKFVWFQLFEANGSIEFNVSNYSLSPLRNPGCACINQCSKICLPNAEHLWVDIQTKRGSIAIVVVYRHPDNSATTMDKFNKEMNELFLTLKMSKRPFYCISDININLLKISKNDVIRRYPSMLINCNCRCLIDVPTRFCASRSTLIDHIYTNDKMNPTASRVQTTSDLSDHYGIFTIISEDTDKKNLLNKITY